MLPETRRCAREACRAEFETTVPSKKYCGKECYHEAHAERRAPSLRRPQFRPEQRRCARCDGSFRATRPHKVYCCYACQLEAAIEHDRHMRVRQEERLIAHAVSVAVAEAGLRHERILRDAVAAAYQRGLGAGRHGTGAAAPRQPAFSMMGGRTARVSEHPVTRTIELESSPLSRSQLG